MDLSKKLDVTSVVVTHEMDSAFTIADRMAMLDTGKMLMIAPRGAYERLRAHPSDRIDELDERERTIRQFLRGDADGPITERRAATNYAEDLLGGAELDLGEGPGVEPTRAM